MKYLKKFENHVQYETYINGSDAILPNVSICTTEGDVHYNPSTPPTPTETRLVCKYDIEDTSDTITLCNDGTNFSAMEIDGVEQAEVIQYYQFDTTGEHTVKYTLKDPRNIGIDAFQNCYRLTTVTIPDSVISIDESAFEGCPSLSRIDIPNSVTSIGNYVFYECSGLESIVIPDSVTSIGDSVFYYCSITSVTIGSSVTTIGEGAFQYNNFSSITIPDSITTIGTQAFERCDNLSIVIVEATIPPTLGTSVFNYNAEGRKIYVPSASVNDYKSATNWSTYASDIEPIS